MKAAVLTGYDKNGRELELRDVPTPQPGPGEVLVRVRTAGVNPLDNMVARGEVKMIVPYRLPLVMGNELVGTVEALGAGTSRFEVGERIYGRMPLARIGAFAEFARRAGLPAWKCLAMSAAGRRYDRMAAKRGQRYRFVFVHEDGEGLERIPHLMGGRPFEASVDGVFGLDDVNAALAKVAAGGSKGKTVLKVS